MTFQSPKGLQSAVILENLELETAHGEMRSLNVCRQILPEFLRRHRFVHLGQFGTEFRPLFHQIFDFSAHAGDLECHVQIRLPLLVLPMIGHEAGTP
ncbi:MAG: hypothetical protein IK066_08995 [Kiritimatiellae bacterium]|nr:hypothetical protein [Kiritimatiellia bacterium]